MKKKIIIIVFLLLCSFHNWATMLGYFTSKFPDGGSRAHYGIAAFSAITGPLGVLPSMLYSNFYLHGFLLK